MKVQRLTNETMIKYIFNYIWYLIQLPIYFILMCCVFTVPLAAMLWGFELKGPDKPHRI